jgi:hypothetical protein
VSRAEAAKLPGLFLLLLLAGCGALEDCLPEAVSSERQKLRADLTTLVHVDQCPGRPTPRSFDVRIKAYYDREQALLARVGKSRFAPDLDQARRDDQEWSRNFFEADCAMYPQDIADEPENVAQVDAFWAGEERQLAEIERRFDALDKACPAGGGA